MVLAITISSNQKTKKNFNQNKRSGRLNGPQKASLIKHKNNDLKKTFTSDI